MEQYLVFRSTLLGYLCAPRDEAHQFCFRRARAQVQVNERELIPAFSFPSLLLVTCRCSMFLQIWDDVCGVAMDVDSWTAHELDRIQRNIKPRHCLDHEALTTILERLLEMNVDKDGYFLIPLSIQDLQASQLEASPCMANSGNTS